jgi:acetyl-CoA carboxylase biotin carboxyl carrier protein
VTDQALPDPAQNGEATEVVIEIEGSEPGDAVEGAGVPATVAEADLLALIDRLAGLLERSDLTELEVEAGGTGLVLRKPVAVAAASAVAAGAPVAEAGAHSTVLAEAPQAPSRPAVTAPLTGIFYASPAPGSAPYVQVGGEVAVGQVIGLIEAMKLFNEIKSDLAGRVVKVVAESGALVKARQPLIEVEPL